MNLPILKDADLKGKRVLLRCDLNVPLTKSCEIADNTRIVESLPTINFLIEHGAKLIIMSHLGRPDGIIVPELKLDPIAKELSLLTGKKVLKLDECIGGNVEEAVSKLQNGEIILLENTRFYPGEEINDKNFTKALAKNGDIFVNDAFGTVHRAHSSTAGLASILPAFAGLLLEKELRILTQLLVDPQKPVCLISGGAKIDTKIGVLNNFLNFTDYFLIGGALANTFLAAQNKNIGASLFEKEKIPVAKDFLEKSQNKKVLLPVDAVVAKETSKDSHARNVDINSVDSDEKILDIGTKTVQEFCSAIASASTIIWNGPLGLYEFPQFEKGSESIAKALASSSAVTIIGGGDTIDLIKKMNIPLSKFTHVSTGGGAMLEFLEGKKLPGIEALMTGRFT